MGQFNEQAARREAPSAGIAIAVTNGVNAQTDLSEHVGRFLTFVFSVKTHIRFGATAQTAVTTDFWLAADSPQDFLITEDRKHIGTYATGASPVGAAAQTG